MDAYRCAICQSMLESGPGNDFELFFNERGHVCWYCIGRAIRMLYLHVKGEKAPAKRPVCRQCNGTGIMLDSRGNVPIPASEQFPCDRCDGSTRIEPNWVPDRICNNCGAHYSMRHKMNPQCPVCLVSLTASIDDPGGTPLTEAESRHRQYV